jgi:RNA polymerase sigma-70 factor (ECF subfamily)
VTDPDPVFEALRPRLFALAYRMLGMVADAEDVLQEAFLRWSATDRDKVREPGAFLTTVVTRLCMDILGSARARRESYVGPWLPEPLLAGDDPAASAELADSLSLAFLVLLEELTPAERAAFLLHDVFGYGYDELSRIVAKDPAACRQLVSRARRHAAARRQRFDADPELAGRLCQEFVTACAGGDIDRLVGILAQDVVVWTDGGGKVKAALRPVTGPERAARFLIGVTRKIPAGSTVQLARLNGQPGVLITVDGAVTAALALDIVTGSIVGVRVVTNPDKLAAVNTAAGR